MLFTGVQIYESSLYARYLVWGKIENNNGTVSINCINMTA